MNVVTVRNRQTHTRCICSVPVGENPSSLQTMLPSRLVHKSSQTVPHRLSKQISTRPSALLCPPRSLTAPSWQRARNTLCRRLVSNVTHLNEENIPRDVHSCKLYQISSFYSTILKITMFVHINLIVACPHHPLSLLSYLGHTCSVQNSWGGVCCRLSASTRCISPFFSILFYHSQVSFGEGLSVDNMKIIIVSSKYITDR